MKVLVTGAAGFIGFHLSSALLARGIDVIGIDNLNDYYDVALKQARLDQLLTEDGFEFHRVDISNSSQLKDALDNKNYTHIVHLAAQPGVRYSIDHPDIYIQTNLVGHANMLELARHAGALEHMIYASSSSVYGGNTKLPYAETDPVDHPVSLYAATKKSGELMSESYAKLYQLPLTGLRFFTVYGPWGRPDMAYWIFTDKILRGEPIRVFNHGDMGRDFTYIDDIIAGIIAVLGLPPAPLNGKAAHRVLNIGNHKAERLPRMIEVLEDALGKRAEIIYEDMQQGDVKETFADISAIQGLTDFAPSTSIEDGLPKFVKWYRGFYGR